MKNKKLWTRALVSLPLSLLITEQLIAASPADSFISASRSVVVIQVSGGREAA